MRASEQHRRHNEETNRLIEAFEQKDREFEDMATADGWDLAEDKVLVTRNDALVDMGDAVLAAHKALNEHLLKSTEFIRNYRILDIQDGIELARFRVSYEQAPMVALKQMRDKEISAYRLQEEQPDGDWVSYYPERGGD